jgi:hypothetical protein
MPDVKVEINAVTDAAERAMRRFEATAESMFRRLLAAASLTALAAFGQKLISVQDELYKMSQRLGITVESLSALRGIAQLANIEMGEFEMMLKTAATQLVNAADGGREAAATFRNLGISARNTDGSIKGLDQLLLEVADKFQSMPDGVRKTDAAVQIFGRSGQRLIPLLNDGRGRILELTEEMRKMGIVISTETARQADEFNNNLTKLKQTIDGLGNRILAHLLPALVKLTESFAKGAQNEEGAKERAEGFAFAMKLLGTAALAVYHVLNLIGQWIATQLTVAASVAIDLFKGVRESVEALTRGLRNSITAWIDFGKSLGGIGPIVSKLKDRDMLGAGIAAMKFWEDFKEKGSEVVSGRSGESVFDGIKKGVENATRNATAIVNQSFDDMATDAQTFVERFNAIWETKADSKDGKAGAGAGTAGGMESILGDRDLYEELYEIDAFNAALAAERKRNEERRLEHQLLEKQARIREVLARDDLSRVEKKEALNQKIREEQALVLQLIAYYRALSTDDKETTEVQLMALERLRVLEEARLESARELRKLYDDGFVATLRRGIVELSDAWENLAESTARTALEGIKSAVQGVGDAIMGAIDGTRTWGQVFGQIAKQIIANLIQVVIQWIAQMTIVKALQTAFSTQQKTDAATRAAAEAPGAALAATSSYGAAAIIGAAALTAILALALSQAFATGGLVQGQGGPMSDNVIARVSPGEYVLRAAAVDHYGLGMVDAMNNLALTKPALAGESGGTAAPAQVHIVQVYNEQDLLRVLQSKMGEQIVVTHIKNNKNEVGIQS